jgi:cell division septal protein FtsQ
MTTWQTPPRPMYRRRGRPRRSESLLAMLLIPILVAMIVMMLLFLPLIAVA